MPIKWTSPAVVAGATDALLVSGEQTFSRFISGLFATTSGQMRLVYFTALKTETINNVRMTSGTAAAATPTLCRIGFFSVAANDDLTLLAGTVSDTALFSAANTAYTKAFSAPVSKIAGQRYAVGVLVVSAAAMPQVQGAAATSAAEAAIAPRFSGTVAGLADLPATQTNASVIVASSAPYAALLP